MHPKFEIGDKVVNQDSVGYVIAELGHNHQGDIEKCKAMFRAAKECGADAVKLQKRDNRALFTQRDVRRAPITARTPTRRPMARIARSWSSARSSTWS